MTAELGNGHVERLFDAIDLIEAGQRRAALPILRGLIQENGDNEEAWLWMSVAVDDIDQSVVCLDNVLRINPKNTVAAAALYRLRQRDLASERLRHRLRMTRNSAFLALWMLILILLAVIFFSTTTQMMALRAA